MEASNKLGSDIDADSDGPTRDENEKKRRLGGASIAERFGPVRVSTAHEALPIFTRDPVKFVERSHRYLVLKKEHESLLDPACDVDCEQMTDAELDARGYSGWLVSTTTFAGRTWKDNFNGRMIVRKNYETWRNNVDSPYHAEAQLAYDECERRILAAWEKNRDEAANFGTRFHAVMERYVVDNSVSPEDERWLGASNKARASAAAMANFLNAARAKDTSLGEFFDVDYRIIATEIRLYDPFWRIVGSIDVVRYRDTEPDGTLVVDIDDWKFSKKNIAPDKPGTPEHKRNVTYNKYAYQQTIYALMLERAAARLGKKLRVHGLRLVQINPTLTGVVNPQPKIIAIPRSYRDEVLPKCEARGRVLPLMWRWIVGTRAALVFAALLKDIRRRRKKPRARRWLAELERIGPPRPRLRRKTRFV